MFLHRKKLSLLLPSLALGGMLLSGCSLFHHVVKKPAADNKSIVILYENDVHCAVDGYPKMAGLRDAIADTAWTQIVCCGDFVQGGTLGALSRGQYIADVMQTMHYDAMTFGNHEFDFKVPHIRSLMKDFDDRITCVNFIDANSKECVYHDFVINEVGNKKIAYVGVTTPSTLITMPTAFINEQGEQIYDLVPEEIVDRVQRAANHARRMGAHYVFVLSHLGEKINETGMTSHKLAAETYGIDAILDGHSHSAIKFDLVKNLHGEDVPISQTGTLFQNVGKLVILPNGKLDFSLPQVSTISQENDTVRQIVEHVKAEAETITKRVVAQSDVALILKNAEGREISRIQETNTGNLVTDAFRIVSGADICILNAGSIRNALAPGQLTHGDLVSLLPYDNRMCLAEVTGQQIHDALAVNTAFLPHPDGQFPVVSGLRYTVNVTTHELSNIEILNQTTGNYEPMDLDKTYTLASTDYAIYDGGLRYTLKDAKIIRKAFAHYCDVFIEYVTKNLNGHITEEAYGHTEGRINIIQ